MKKYSAMTEKMVNRIAMDIPKRNVSDLRNIQSLIQAELDRRSSKSNSTQRLKAAEENKESKEGTVPSYGKNSPVLSALKYEDRVGNIIRSKNYIMTVPGAFMRKNQRFAIRKTAETLGGVKLGKGDKVYDAYAKMDKYIMVIKFQTAENAIEFMHKQHGYSPKAK